MPHLILQLVALLVYFPQQTVYLSVYESGSRDATGGASLPCSWIVILHDARLSGAENLQALQSAVGENIKAQLSSL
jgi:hypothetical protein